MAEPFNLSPQAAAALIGCHEDTLKRWAADGKVPAFRTPGGWWRFRQSDIESFLRVKHGCCPNCDQPTWHNGDPCPNEPAVAS